jgi:translation initiation factor 2B subunit (eIF-2B alpha/beta/delta family)
MDMNPAAAGALRSGLEELKTDHQSGSHELTSIAVKAFRDILVHLRSDRKWWETARIAAWHLWKNGRESMGSATLNALLGVLADIEDMKDLSLDDERAMDRVLGMIDHHLEVRRQMPSCIKDSFVAYLQANGSRDTQTVSILTLSASSTIRDSILDAFASLPMPNLDLRILESRPLFEGASMASSLLSAFESKFPAATGRHLRLTVYTDASAALAATNVEFVLLGADRLSSSGWVSNKTGSLPAVLSAKHASPSCKVLVFSGLEKVAEPGAEHEHEPEENDYREVMTPWIECGVRGVNILEEGIRGIPPKTANCYIQVKNIYFEWVPSELIDGYICEKGMFSAAAIQKYAQEVRENSRAYFGSL